ncbi:MAG: hypothetical protein WD512_12995 [Candidatus Paceibacterota bacterium]
MNLPKLVEEHIRYYILKLKYKEEKYKEYKKKSEQLIYEYKRWNRMSIPEKAFERLLQMHEF